MTIFDVFRTILLWFYQPDHIALLAILIIAVIALWYGQQQVNGVRQ